MVHTCCKDYLEGNGVLSDRQSGFRQNRSTGTCLVDFLNVIYTGIDAGNAVGGLFLDLAKAFDCVGHNIILTKLKCLGFKSCLVRWFKSYLENRVQSTVVNDVCLSNSNVVCGVPQGSILGPMLFVCYINDVEKHLQFSTPFLFADDTALLVEGSLVDDIGNKLNTDLNILTMYFAANNLQLNAKKTKSLLFRSTQKFEVNNELLLQVRTEEIEQVENFKYLGVYVDSHLTFKSHLEHITKKLKQRTAVLWRMRGFISRNLAFQLFNSLIKPLYTYCDFVYDGCSATVSKQFEVLQNAGLKAVRGIPGIFSATEL